MPLCLALTGCSGDVIPVHVYGLDDEAREDLLAGVEEEIGFAVEDVGGDYGAIKIKIVPETEDLEFWGHTIDVNGCRRRIWAIERPRSVAHEIGHVLGLEHVDDADTYNLMQRYAFSSELSPKQRDKVRRNIRLLDACPFSG